MLRWEYCGAKKARIEAPANYEELKAAYIRYDIVDAPDTSERRQRRLEERAAAEEKAKTKRKTATRRNPKKAAKDQTTE